MALLAVGALLFGRTILLGIWGAIPESLKKRIEEERDLEVLNRWLIEAANTSSVNEFLKNIE